MEERGSRGLVESPRRREYNFASRFVDNRLQQKEQRVVDSAVTVMLSVEYTVNVEKEDLHSVSMVIHFVTAVVLESRG